ncbi:hypothetical protein RF11_05085 [Thelohanellus kitauei]|uniref:Uncharacterized protein n=1 Tax=Thelohanellus kitauei TaxID=669202 RepID=A0A0C2MNH4_THEKT|nr:hypothetical protein RF11_05085 [Thelohanellus kitauei]
MYEVLEEPEVSTPLPSWNQTKTERLSLVQPSITSSAEVCVSHFVRFDYFAFLTPPLAVVYLLCNIELAEITATSCRVYQGTAKDSIAPEAAFRRHRCFVEYGYQLTLPAYGPEAPEPRGRPKLISRRAGAKIVTVVDLSGQNLMHHLRHSHNISSDLTSLTSSSPAKVAGQSAPGKHRAGRKANNYNELATSATPNNPCHNLRILPKHRQTIADGPILSSLRPNGYWPIRCLPIRGCSCSQGQLVSSKANPGHKRKERGSITSSEGQAATIALHKSQYRDPANQTWFRPPRRLDSCATADATGVESVSYYWSTSSSTLKSRGYSGCRE